MTERRTVRFTVAPEDAGGRLDKVLAERVPGLSRRRARVLLDIGGVFVDRTRVKVASRAVRAGQVVEAHLGGALDRAAPEVGRRARARDDARLPRYQIRHRDGDVIVVDKPASLLAAPTPESDRGNLLDLLSRRLDRRVFAVHRIDLPTSGLLVYALTRLANRELSAAFRAHAVRREYLAVVAGDPPAAPEGIQSGVAPGIASDSIAPEGVAGVAPGIASDNIAPEEIAPGIASEDVGPEEIAIDSAIAGRRAVTRLAVLERFPSGAQRGQAAAALVRARLETGRTHQIRIHCERIGHPVLGDPTYGSPTAVAAAPRLALHAAVLGFEHPRTGEPIHIESPWPDDLAAWLDALRGLPGRPDPDDADDAAEPSPHAGQPEPQPEEPPEPQPEPPPEEPQ